MDADHLVAHRGDPERYPENTRVSLEAAVSAGARFLEFDIQFSADGVPVLFHDAALHRCSNGNGAIAEQAWEELDSLSAGEPLRFGERFASERIPRLDDTARWLAGKPDVFSFVELKREVLDHFTREEVLERLAVDLQPIRGRFSLISFDHDLLALARSRGFDQIGWVLENLQCHAPAESLAPDELFIDSAKTDAGFQPWPGPWKWAVYCVDKREELQGWLDRGFHYIESNCIGKLLEESAHGE